MQYQKIYNKKKTDGTIGHKKHVLFIRKHLKFYDNIWSVLISITKDRDACCIKKLL